MHNIWTSSAFLYTSDATLTLLFFLGLAIGITWLSRTLTHSKALHTTVTYQQLRNLIWRVLFCEVLAIILFKWIVMQGGPNVGRWLLTGAHGSDQYSSASELLGGLLLIWGTVRAVRWIFNKFELTNEKT